jgi:hypothetical protein
VSVVWRMPVMNFRNRIEAADVEAGIRNRALVLTSLALAAVLGGACVSDDGPEASRCSAEPGTAIDVAGEPDWRQYADYRTWTDSEGCLVRIDVLAERPGPEHCDWQDADVLISGRPIGARYTSSDDDLSFVRDPKSVFGRPELSEGVETKAIVPDNAIDSGFRRGGTSLWHIPGDEAAVWLVSGTSAERWPQGESPVCA